MASPDQGLRELKSITTEFADFCSKHGAASESDTRAKIIDRILALLGWPEAAISRENRVLRDSETGDKSTYMDYCLSVLDKRLIVLEAKRESIPFTMPTGNHKFYSLDGTLVSHKNIKLAINQVRGYCDDEGIRFAIATNGYVWIAFRAVRDDTPWRKGLARVFPSLKYIESHFTDFYNLLSFEAVASGSLQRTFSASLRPSRRLHRVIDRLFNADLPLQRNRLNTALQPWIKLVFEDIADQEHLDVLQQCYVHTGSLVRVANELGNIFAELIPTFLYEQGAKSIGHAYDEKGFERSFSRALHATKGELFLLLGGIGAGKTTFLKRYQRTSGAELLKSA